MGTTTQTVLLAPTEQTMEPHMNKYLWFFTILLRFGVAFTPLWITDSQFSVPFFVVAIILLGYWAYGGSVYWHFGSWFGAATSLLLNIPLVAFLLLLFDVLSSVVCRIL